MKEDMPKINRTVCKRCGHSWFPRPDNDTGEVKKPKICPSCKSAWWEEEKK